jgi:DNA ligase-1
MTELKSNALIFRCLYFRKALRMKNQLTPRLTLLATALCWPLFAYQPSLAAPSPNTPDILLADSYKQGINPSAYLVSEKLDGVRAVWNGQTLTTRGGLVIKAPAWFTAKFPKVPLDGELWMARGQFDAVSAAIRRSSPIDAEWQKITYQLYELPKAQGDFSARFAAITRLVQSANSPYLKAVPQFKVSTEAQLMATLDEIVAGGGEGLMLHRADSLWHTGRSAALLKLKKIQDAEAKVVGYTAGKGKYEGQVGALILALPDGRTFKVGSGLTDALRKTPPPLNTLITYRYRDTTKKGLPRFATFLRVRD